MRLIDADEYRKCLIEHMTVPWERAKYDISDDYNKGLYDAARMLNTEPTITPEPHWIPVTERLPKEDVDVLCQTISGAKLVASYGFLNPWGKEKGWITSEFNRLSKEMIEAWMPLPEPYKGVTT